MASVSPEVTQAPKELVQRTKPKKPYPFWLGGEGDCTARLLSLTLSCHSFRGGGYDCCIYNSVGP